MAKFNLTCSCGHSVDLEAPTREDAVKMFQAGMTQEALDEHFRTLHNPSEQKPTLEQAHGMISQVVAAAA